MTDPISRLAVRRRETLDLIEALGRRLDGIIESSAYMANDDEHDPEGVTVAFERAQVGLLDQARAELRALDAADERLAAGTYGTCGRCGDPIAAERLDARPAVTHLHPVRRPPVSTGIQVPVRFARTNLGSRRTRQRDVRRAMSLLGDVCGQSWCSSTKAMRREWGAVGVALVTGAAQGLGAVIAQRLAGDGWAVAVNDLPGMMAAAEEVAADIAASGDTAVAVGADVTDGDHVHALVERVSESLGSVSVLVVNATGPQPVIRLEALTWQDHLSHLELFVKSPTLLTQAVLPGMKAAGRGRIVQIGSDMAETALAGWSHYVAAKSAQLGLTRCWARELGPFNITVNLVAPGWIPVERHADATAGELADYLADVPLARIGTPTDVAATVAFLASDDAAFLTGQCIPVNGGRTFSR